MLHQPLRSLILCMVIASLFTSCQSNPQPTASHVALDGTRTARAVPPPMPKRPIAPSTQPDAGKTIIIEEAGNSFTLFIPNSWRPQADGGTLLTINFHGTPWFLIQEYLRRGLTTPLLAYAPGEGSTIYRKSFEDPTRLERLLRLVEHELKKQGAPANTQITALDISSISAGYGAVREIVKQPQYVKMIRRIVLADSLYASWDPASTQPGATPRPDPENITPWLPYIRAAARGEKVFILTHSQVPTANYANSAATAKALIDAVGAKSVAVPKGTLPATFDPDYPLLARADLNGFHIWSYGGADPGAHMTHARHLADVWHALDEAERAAR
jgi:hypothetical protein